MEETLVSILQEKADKCSTEQIWAVGTLSALSAFLITQREILLPFAGSWAWCILVASTLATVYGSAFIWYRNKLHAYFAGQQLKLIEGHLDKKMKKPQFWLGFGESGAWFYQIVILGAWAASIPFYI